MEIKDKIFIAGSRGLVGSALIRYFIQKGYINLLIPPHSELEFMDSQAVSIYFKQNKPDYVFLAAAKIGGILVNNTCPADFIYQNLMIQNNIIHQAFIPDLVKSAFKQM
jgi:GDP-L-fucose synthase